MPHGGDGIEKNESIPRRLRSQGNQKDVFALVKANMADVCLIQPPLLVWPHSLLSSVEQFWNQINVTDEIVTQRLEESRANELLELAEQIQQDFPHMDRCVRYYRSLVDARQPRKPYERLMFIDAGPNASSRVGDVRLGQRPQAPRPHQLEVVFHHAA